MVTGTSGTATTPLPQLEYLRTLDRTLVHRWALSEVFLTDFQELEPNHCLAAAQLPTSHAYYTDHLGPREAIDPVLILECSRQVATCAAHRLLGVPHDSAFLVSDWSLELPGPSGPRRLVRPGELLLDLRVTDHLVRGGTTRGASFAVQLLLDGVSVGHVSISARYTPAEEAVLLRRHLRRSDPPSSTTLPSVPAGAPVVPETVRRRDPANAALTDAALAPGQATARVAVPGNHPTHFDHPQDHFTAMTLVEAARQAAWLALTDSAPPSTARVSAFRAGFLRFAELDAPVVADAVTKEVRELGSDMVGATVPVVFRQDGVVVSEVEVAVEWPSSPSADSSRHQQEAL